MDLKKLKAGDVIKYTGVLYTARDAAHMRLKKLLEEGKELPVDFKGQIVYYAGPTPTPPGRAVGSIGPTTSSRMDSFMDLTVSLGLAGMVGKGPRSENVRKACGKYGIVYFVTTGGAGALLSTRVESSEVVAFQDLGCEAIRKLKVRDFPLIVAFDASGASIFERNKTK